MREVSFVHKVDNLAHATNATSHLAQSSSAFRFTAGASEFFILSQSGKRPEQWTESLRFETMLSRPSLETWAKTVGPSPSMCSLNRMPGPAFARRERGLADL